MNFSQNRSKLGYNILMGDSNAFVSAFTLYRHLKCICSHPSNVVVITICKVFLMKKFCYKAESKIMFVCPRPPDPQFTPRLEKLYSIFAGEKYFYRLPPKRLIVCQESSFNHTC